MKRVATVIHLCFIAMIVSMFLGGVAWAQEPGAVPMDLTKWFVDTAALAGVIVALTALVRKHIWKTLDGALVPAFSLAIGAGLGALGHYLGYVDGALTSGLLFGLGAGLTASGGVDGLRAILGSGKTSENSSTATDASRLRTR